MLGRIMESSSIRAESRGVAASAPTYPVELVVGPRMRPLGGLEVNRVWPTAARRLIGPFIFLDHLERAPLAPGMGLDVPPHPHIGLATVTYLFEGELVHADSLGMRETIRPGELNWMTAGRGITHAERTGPEERARPAYIHGIQSWVALPIEEEDCEPGFAHHAAGDLPELAEPGVRLKLIAGEAFGARSPVAVKSGLFYVEADVDAGRVLGLPAELGERGCYVVAGRVRLGAAEYPAGRMLVLASGADVRIEAVESSKLMLLGGAPLEGDRHVWWNFVSSKPERIETAKRDWAEERFPPVPGDRERMPLPP